MRTRLASLWLRVWGAAIAAAFLGTFAATAFARGSRSSPAAPPPTKSYATAYLLVAMCILLGLVAVLRPTKRSPPE
jgi:hypothetical protein